MSNFVVIKAKILQ